MKKLIKRGKRSKTLNEVKPVDISNSVLEISPVQKKSLLHINYKTTSE